MLSPLLILCSCFMCLILYISWYTMNRSNYISAFANLSYFNPSHSLTILFFNFITAVVSFTVATFTIFAVSTWYFHHSLLLKYFSNLFCEMLFLNRGYIKNQVYQKTTSLPRKSRGKVRCTPHSQIPLVGSHCVCCCSHSLTNTSPSLWVDSSVFSYLLLCLTLQIGADAEADAHVVVMIQRHIFSDNQHEKVYFLPYSDNVVQSINYDYFSFCVCKLGFY